MSLQSFAFRDQPVRVVLDAAGDPWFVATDVAKILGHRDAERMTRLMEPDERGTHIVGTPGGTQSVATVSEPGLYGAIMRRQSGSVDNAEVRGRVQAFQRWVTHEVLPAIRETGSYTSQPAQASVPDITTPEGLVFLTEKFAATARALLAAQVDIAELQPRAEFADRLLNADGDLSVADAAKALTRAGVVVGSGRLFTVLSDRDWLFRGGDGRWRVYQRAIDGGWMSVLPQSHYHPKTGVLVLDPPQPRVTAKGLQRLLLDHGAVNAVPALPGLS